MQSFLIRFGTSILFLFLSACFVTAQKQHSVKTYNQYRYQDLTSMQIQPQAYFAEYSSKMGLTDSDKMVLDKRIPGYSGMVHDRYTQKHKGLDVIGSNYILHHREDQLLYTTGDYLPHIQVETTASINAAEAINTAIEEMDAKLYAWETNTPNLDNKLPEAKLCIVDRALPVHSNQYALAYEIEVYAMEPLDKRLFYIDAHTGKVITHITTITNTCNNGGNNTCVHATGESKYYGTVDFISDSLDTDHYVLRDLSRGEGITIYNADMDSIVNDDTTWDLSGEERMQPAIDLIYCTSKFYDLLLINHKWDGLDNEGGSMNCIVDVRNGDYVNAYWDGTNTYYGSGDCHYGPLTTMEIVGHEFMHGVTHNTSKLIYNQESGAINESISDMMGKAIEYFEDPDRFNWFIGASMIESTKVNPFRNMADPPEFNDPDYYKGNDWRDGAGVHTNSGVGNKWFYLLVEGGTGISGNNTNYNVQGIGMEAASKIAFLTNVAYLSESSDYNAFYRNSQLAAIELYGDGSDELASVIEAWRAVGLPFGDPIADLDLAVVSVEEEFIISTCIDNGYWNMELMIINTSSTDYTADLGAVLDFRFAGEDILYPLDETISAGDTLTISFPNQFLFDETDDYNTNVVLDFVDYNANNNREFIYVSNSILQEPDLTLNINPTVSECGASGASASISLENIGCSLPANEEINLVIEDENGVEVYSREIVLFSEFPQNNTRLYFADFIPTGSTNYIGRVTTNLDFDNANNEVQFTIPKDEQITAAYFNGFSTESELFSTLRVSNTITFDDEVPIYLYDGEPWYASTGYFTNYFGIYCEDDIDAIFNDNSYFDGVNSNIEMCVDLDGLLDPHLSFDMIHFQNQSQEDFAQHEAVSSMVRITYDGTELINGGVSLVQLSEVIYPQEEAKQVKHNFPLPNGFAGSIKFDFFNMTGANITDTNFLNYDVTLMDNLEIREGPTSLSELEDHQLTIYPNPTSNLIQVQVRNSTPTSYELVDLHGRTVMKGYDTSQQMQLDLSSFNSGVYQLLVYFDDDQFVSEKLVVLK